MMNIKIAQWYSLLAKAVLVFFAFLFASSAFATVTVNYTFNTWAEYLYWGNSSPGKLLVLQQPSQITNGDGNYYTATYNNVTGVNDITGNGNGSFTIASSGGYFSVSFYRWTQASSALSCSTTPVNYGTSTGFIPDGGSFTVNITCNPIPSTPILQSAVIDAAGTSLTLTYDQGVSVNSYINSNADYQVTVGGVSNAVTANNIVGSTVVLTLTTAATSGQVATVTYSGGGGGVGVCDIAEDTGTYCAANFSNQSITNNSTVSGVTPPAAPTGLVATPGNGQVSIAFTAGADNGSAITNYQYSTNGGGAWTAFAPADTTSPVVVTGLTNGTSYSITLRAINAGGNGTSSSAVVATPRTVPGAPSSPVATAGNAQATVTFTAPGSNGGSAITTYTATASGGGGQTGTCAGPAACTITVTGLTNGTAYTFTVTATNAAGTGSASSASSSVTPQAPQTITFNNPGAQNFGTTPTLSATASSTLTVSFSSGTTSVCTITSGGALTFLTTGTCTIHTDQAGNASFLAASRVSQTFTVNAVVPGAPTIGTATAGNAQATVTFTAPVSNGGAAITTYTATASGVGAQTGTCAGPAACAITVTGLTNGTAYTFTVTATNAAGTGSASAASNSVTPLAPQTITFNNPGAQNFGTTPTLSATASSTLTVSFSSGTTSVCTITSGGALTFVTAGTCTINADQAGNGTYAAATTVSQSFAVNAVVPGAPTIGTATGGDTQASVTFTAPAFNGGSAITGYTATSNPGGLTGTCASSPCTVTGLNNGTAYTFTVTATNSAGTGSASAASNSVTPKAAQTITFANPGAQNFGTTPTLSATASSSLTVSFTSSTTSVCTVTSGGALTFVTTGTCTINANQAGDGTYLAAPQVSQSFTVNAVVPGAPTIGTASTDNAQSSVSFTAPAFNGGATIDQYTATCTSSNGGATGTNTGASSPIVVAGLTNGKNYTCSVTAHNSVGNGAASAASNAITPAPGPAVVSVAAPANGSYRAGQNLDFTITWDQATTLTGTPSIALVIGATTVQANFVSSPTSTTSLFRYTVLAGQTDSDGIAVGALSLNGGTIRNAANTDATLTLNSVGSTTSVLVDTTAPTLPAANIVVNNQADPHKLVLTFSEALASGSLGSAAGWTVTANGGTPSYTIASVALSGGNQVTLTLSAVDLSNASSTIANVAANAHLKVTPPATLTDVAGNTYAAGQVTESGATLVLDATAPTLSAVATSGPTTSGGVLAATASEKALGYWIAVATGSTAPTPAQTQAGVNYGAVTVIAHGSGALPNATPGSLTLTGLSASTTYDIYVVAQDAAGNLSAAASTATLTTAAVPNPFTQLPTPPSIPGVSGLPGVVNMASGSAPAISNCLMDILRQTLGSDAVYLGQTASGEVRVGWNGQIISFYPLAANTTDARSTGLHNQSINPLDVVTSCGTLNVTPALFNPTALGAFLAGMGATAQINPQGVITVLYNGSYYVVRPDYVVTTGTPGGPSLGFGPDGLLRFTDANGNTQKLHPAVLDPAALQTQVSLMGGSMVVQLDGTVLVVFGNGQRYVLTPDLILAPIPPQFSALNSWPDGLAHYSYRIMTAPFTLYSQGVSVSVKP